VREKTILDEILAWKEKEVAARKAALPLDALAEQSASAPPPRDLSGALRRPGVSLIAEVKRASPSKGSLRPDLDPAALAAVYQEGGASAISVLTDERYFQGSLADLRAVRKAAGLPVLRKDFVIDAYQLWEARAAGADAVLLIVAALDDSELAALYAGARKLGMSALVEVHDAREVERALQISPRILGVNNRDLHTFKVDLETTARLRARIPPEVTLVAESGVHTRADVQRLAEIGADAALVGESLVRAPDPAAKIRELLGQTVPVPGHSGRREVESRDLDAARGDRSRTRIKICGITRLADAQAAARAGADMLGFIFYPPSPRAVPVGEAARIVRAIRQEFGSAAPWMVGVFVNEPPERVREVLREAGLDLAQIHGDEAPERTVEALAPAAYAALRSRTPVQALDEAARFERAMAADKEVPQILADAYDPQRYGGTGQEADPEVARALAARYRLLLAGGLTPENVGRAIAAISPWGVDVASGVEAAPGIKDHGRVRAFCDAVRAADAARRESTSHDGRDRG
jgi:indole-3-glycerol phosphate synthase/phosphoribosylanthranilate isomerase